MRLKIITTIILVLATVLLLQANPINAAAFEGLSVFPQSYDPKKSDTSARFEFQLYPGEQVLDRVRIVNKTGQDSTYKAFAADGRTTADGAFALAGVNEEKKDVGNWITLDNDEIFIPNGEEGFIDFTLNIPDNAEVGDHLGGISVFNIEQDEKKQTKDGIVLNIKTRVGVRTYITVLGELDKKMEITDFKGGLNSELDKVVFNFGLANTGNVRVEPEGDIVVYNSFLGSESSRFPIDLRLVLPDQPTNVPITWEHTPLLGKYTVRANVRYGSEPNEVVQKEIEIAYITKRAKIIIGAVLLVMVIVFVVAVKKMTTSKISKR